VGYLVHHNIIWYVDHLVNRCGTKFCNAMPQSDTRFLKETLKSLQT